MMMSAWLPRHHHMMAVSALLSLSSRPCKFRPAPDPKDATLQAATAIGHADRVAPIIKAVVEDNWLETAEDALCGWIPTWRESRAQ